MKRVLGELAWFAGNAGMVWAVLGVHLNGGVICIDWQSFVCGPLGFACMALGQSIVMDDKARRAALAQPQHPEAS